MIFSILLGALAAWGLLCAVWAAFGWLLPGSGSVTLVLLCPKTHSEAAIARCRWLLGLGLLRGRLIVAGAKPPGPFPEDDDDLEFCSLEDLPIRLEAERG